MYRFLWKTDRKWAGSCSRLLLKLDDGTMHAADFQFTRHGSNPAQERGEDDDQ